MKIDTKTKLFAVIGSPVEHSKSPLIHNIALKENKINAIYTSFKVENVSDAINAMRKLNFSGYSVTIPHKVEIIKYLDEIDPFAKKIGAVNTVHNVNGKLIGYNTDCDGAIDALKEKTKLHSKKIYLLGAGGAARAIIAGLVRENALVTIFVRNLEEANIVAKEFNINVKNIESIDSEFDILINATPVGMYPNINATPVSDKIFKKGQVVMDIIFNPLKTKLLKEAQKKGCVIILGTEMFLNQGIEQFKIWNKNKKAPIKKMRSALIKELKKEQNKKH